MTAVAPLALPTLPAAFQQSNVDYLAILPLLIVFGTALIGVLVEAFAARERRHAIQVGLAVVGLLAAAASIIIALLYLLVPSLNIGNGIFVSSLVIFLIAIVAWRSSIGILLRATGVRASSEATIPSLSPSPS